MPKKDFFNEEVNAIQVFKSIVLCCGFFIILFFGGKVIWYLQEILKAILSL